jgi:hypothetical protein
MRVSLVGLSMALAVALSLVGMAATEAADSQRLTTILRSDEG